MTTYDLAVVGAGIAGLTAANRAAELGCRVVVLEKGDGRALSVQLAHRDRRSQRCPHRSAFRREGAAAGDRARYRGLRGARACRRAGRALRRSRCNGCVRKARASSRCRSTARAAGCWRRRARSRPASTGKDAALTSCCRRCVRTSSGAAATIMLATRARALRMEQARCIGVTAEQGGRALDHRGCDRAARGRRLSGKS